jgi:cytoskeletal protein RodZ
VEPTHPAKDSAVENIKLETKITLSILFINLSLMSITWWYFFEPNKAVEKSFTEPKPQPLCCFLNHAIN